MEFISKLRKFSPKILENKKIAPLIELYKDLELTLKELRRTEEGAKKAYQINVQKLIEQLTLSKKRLERKIINTLLLEKQHLKRKLLKFSEDIHKRLEEI